MDEELSDEQRAALEADGVEVVEPEAVTGGDAEAVAEPEGTVAEEAEQVLEDHEQAPLNIAEAFAATGDEEPGQEAAAGEAIEAQPEVQPLVTEAAFIVYIRDDGHWVADSESINRPVISGRTATFDDMQIASMVIHDDIVMQKTAQATVQFQQQAAAAMAQQMQGQAMMQQLMREGKIPGMDATGPGGMVLPNRQQRRHPNG